MQGRSPFLYWVYEPFAGKSHAVLWGIYCYLTDYQYRVGARARHVTMTAGAYSKYLSGRLCARHKIVIPHTAEVGCRLQLPHPFGVVIGRDVVIGDDVTIYQNVTLGQNRGLYPSLGDGVIVYPNSVVTGNVKVGSGVVIGAGSVVTKDVPDNAIVAGVPASIIKFRDGGLDGGLR